MPKKWLEEGGNHTRPPILPLCLFHTPPCLLVPLDLPSLLITTIVRGVIEFPLLVTGTLDADHRRGLVSRLGDLVLGHRPICRICVYRIPMMRPRTPGEGKEGKHKNDKESYQLTHFFHEGRLGLRRPKFETYCDRSKEFIISLCFSLNSRVTSLPASRSSSSIVTSTGFIFSRASAILRDLRSPVPSKAGAGGSSASRADF